MARAPDPTRTQAFGPEALGKLAAGLAGYAAVDGPLVAALCGRAEQLAGGMGVLDINRWAGACMGCSYMHNLRRNVGLAKVGRGLLEGPRG